MASRRHLTAFNRAVRARGLDAVDQVAPMVVLGRDLARLIDARGLTARSLAAYRAVLREVECWPVVVAAGSTESEPESGSSGAHDHSNGQQDGLAAWRAERGIGS